MNRNKQQPTYTPNEMIDILENRSNFQAIQQNQAIANRFLEKDQKPKYILNQNTDIQINNNDDNNDNNVKDNNIKDNQDNYNNDKKNNKVFKKIDNKIVEKEEVQKQGDYKDSLIQFEDDIEAENKPILAVDNSEFYLENKNNHKLDIDDECELKRQFLYVINDDFDRKGEEQKQSQQEFHGKLMFLVLNKMTLSFYESADLSELQDVYHTVNIEKNPLETIIENRHCFYIQFIKQERQMNVFELEQTHNARYKKSIICASNIKDMYRWIDLINNMKFCDEKKVDIEQIKDNENREKDIQEDIHDDPIDLSPDFLEMQNMFRLKEQARKMQKRKKLEEIQIMQQKIQKIKEQKKCLEDSLIQKEALEREAHEQLLNSEKQILMKERLKKAMEEIDNIEQNKENEEEDLENQIKEEQQRQIEKEAQEMVEMAFESQKLMDPSACYAQDQVAYPTFDLYQQKACGQMFLSYDDKGIVTHDIIMYQKCREPKQFCEICCNQFIGKSHFSQRQLCTLRCKEFQNNYDNNYKIEIPFSQNLNIDISQLYDPNVKGITDKQSSEDKEKIKENLNNQTKKDNLRFIEKDKNDEMSDVMQLLKSKLQSNLQDKQ